MTTKEFMESRTELELHVLQYLKDTGEPMDIEFYLHAGDSFHCLDEFADAYERKDNGFSVYNTECDEELQERINQFLKIVQRDKDTGEYRPEDFELVMELIDELGL